MAWNIYPTETPVGSFVADLSNRIREFQLARKDFLMDSSRNFLSWQYTLSIGSGLSVDVAAGEAFVSGYYVYSSATVNVAGLAPSTTNYVYLQLVKTGSLVTSAQILANTTGTLPSDSVLVGWAITHTDHVDSVVTAPIGNRPVIGNYAGDGTAGPRTILVGVTPRFGLVYGNQLWGTIVAATDYGCCISASPSITRALGGSSENFPAIATHGFTVKGTTGFNATAVSYTYILWT